MAHAPTCTCTVGPGKFEGESPLTALGYWHVGNGGSDADYGTVSFFKAPLNFHVDQEALAFARSLGFCPACIDEDIDAGLALTGVMIREDDAGFVFCRRITTQAAYDELEAAYYDRDDSDDE